jgi:hypothetical protein
MEMGALFDDCALAAAEETNARSPNQDAFTTKLRSSVPLARSQKKVKEPYSGYCDPPGFTRTN